MCLFGSLNSIGTDRYTVRIPITFSLKACFQTIEKTRDRHKRMSPGKATEDEASTEEEEEEAPQLQLQQPTFSQVEEGLSQDRPLQSTHQNVSMPAMSPLFHNRLAYQPATPNNMFATQFNPYAFPLPTSGRQSAPTLPTPFMQEGTQKKSTHGTKNKATTVTKDAKDDTKKKGKRHPHKEPLLEHLSTILKVAQVLTTLMRS